MEELIRLYKTNKDKGMEYLYENINVFISQTGIKNYILDDYMDYKHDCYLLAHNLIEKSIEKDYDPRQIYSYIVLRLRGILINELGDNRIVYTSGINNIEDREGFRKAINAIAKDEMYNKKNELEVEFMVEALHEYINYLEGAEKSIMLLRYFGEDNTIKDIARHLDMSEAKVYRKHNQLVKRAKKFLKDKMGEYEN